MNTALSSYPDASVVKGSSNEYIESGLSSNFNLPLKSSDYEDSRLNQNIKTIGSNHAKLYDCDLKSIKYNKIVSRINIILADQTLQDQILLDIKEVIKRWSQEEVTKYGDVNSQAFKDWMKERLKEKIMELEDDNTLFSFIYLPKQEKTPFKIYNINNPVDYIDYYNSMASIDNTFGNKISLSEKEEIAFYLENGFNSIKGIDRVHYLAAMTQSVSANGTATPNVMPLKISSSTGSMIYTIFLDQFEFTETSATFDACIKIEDAESGKILVFRAQNIVFGPGGTKDPFRLELVNDNVSLRINNAAKIHLYKQFTYVEFNCEGFYRAGIKADVEFCPEYILPLDENGKVIANKNYKLHIDKLEMNKWMEFTFVMDAAPFAMTKYENIQWEISKMVIDTDSGAGANIQITPPLGYESSVSPNSGSWKGFYVAELKVKFLPELPSSGNNPVEVEIKDLIIDGTGVSAYATGPLKNPFDGNMSGWPFSINKFSLHVLHNNVAGFGFGGGLKLPVFKEKLDYLAEVYSGGKYKFAVSLADNLTCPLFIAKANIYNDSEVGVVYDGTKFIATATLNGDIKVGSNLIPGVNGVFPSIGFTGMQVSTQAPYFNIGTWDVKGDGVKLDFGAFEMSIGLPQGYKPGGDATNGVILPVRLELDGKYKIYASGNIAVLGEMTGEGGGIHDWDYSGYEIQKFCIGGSFPGVKSINGCLIYFENKGEFGTGFQAAVDVEFEKFLNRIQAVGCFGRVPAANGGFKYFFVDATASLQKSIPLGAIALNGFCGGVSNHMSSTFDPNVLNFTDNFDPSSLPIGSSASGISYRPDESFGLGLKAGARFVLSSLPSLTNGSILIKMDFAASGGLKEFGMKGTAKFLEVPQELLPFVAAAGRPDIEAVMVANVDLKVNSSGVFGKFECFLNAGFMYGNGTQGKLVDAVVKFTASEWYIWIGQPEPKSLRAGMKMNLGIINTDVNSYFCMGSKIPNFPEIPYEIRKHIPSFASASSLRGGGGGLVFGGSLTIEAHVNAYVASGTVTAMTGFDIMIRDYSGMSCASSPGEPIGLNGWYGSGQAWALLSGKVDVLGVNVFKATIAAAFQARLPNPTFIEAAVSLEACFIKCFDVDMHITIGEICEVQSNDPNNVLGTQVVSNIIPFTNTQDLALEYKPQIFFNVPIKDGVKIKDLAGNEKSYNVRIKKLELNSMTLDIPIAFEKSYNNTNTILTIVPKYLLPKGDSLELIIETEVLEGSNEIQKEEKRVVFYTTSSLPTFANNISMSYPMATMNNFYKDEVNEEFIVLKQILYDYIEGTEADLKIKLCPKGSSNGQEVPFTMVDYGKKFTFDISPLLLSETHYELKIFEVESSQEGQTQSDREVLSIPFRTSKFATFADKIASFCPVPENVPILGTSDFSHNVQFSPEPFDDIEINNRLVRAELFSEDYRKTIHDTYRSYTRHSDEFIEEYCGIEQLPGCLDCVPASVYLTKDACKYNAKWKNSYKKNVVGFLKYYFDKIADPENGLGFLPPGDVYDFYLSYNNFRGNSSSGVRAEPDPYMVLMYYTPDGIKMSFQEVR